MDIKRVLVVDDDIMTLMVIKSIIDYIGVKAHFTTSCEEAIELLRQGSIEIMITDLNMPDMDGYSLSRIAKGINPKINIVMITGDISPSIHSLAEQAGVSEVITKPFGSAQIMQLFAEKAVL